MTYAADDPIIGGVMSPITTAVCVRTRWKGFLRMKEEVPDEPIESQDNASRVSISIK